MTIFSLENYKDFIDQHPEGFYQIRFQDPLDNEILFLNPAAERLIYGTFAPGQKWFATVPPDDRTALRQVIEDALRVGSWDLTYRVQTPDGVAWVRDQAIVTGQEGGWSAFGSVSDITELQEAQFKLVQSEERLRLAALCVSDFLYEKNLETGKISWFGGKEGHDYMVDFPGSTHALSKLLHPEDRTAYEASAKEAVDRDKLFSLEYRIRATDGSYRWWSDRGLCMRDEDGSPLRWLGAISDVTSKRDQQLQLANTERAYRQLMESLMDLVWTIDEEDRFVFINGPSRSILGYDPNEMIGKKFSEFQPTDLGDRDREMFKRVRRGEEAVHHRTVLVTSKGTRRSFSVNARIAKDAGEGRVLVHGTARDVTDLHLLEQQFIQSQKMETVGKLAGGIAHDFNNLLTIIHGYASMLISRGSLDGLSRREVTQIAQAAEKAESLTRQLLAFSRQQVMQPQPVHLDLVVRNLLEMLKRVIGEHIQLQTNLSSESCQIHGDPNMIEQVLVNLLVNARDAMPDGGTIRIDVAPIMIDDTYCRTHPEGRIGPHVCLTVEDNGTGIVPEVAKHVFEPFFTTKEEGKGTGLGLPTVYGIVQQHNGWITLASEPAKGTAFHIYFPKSIARPEDPLEPPKICVPPESGTETILVVEDEPEVLALASSLLMSRGYTVWEAQNAVEADLIFADQKHKIDLLLTDVVLPGGRSGRDLASEFRRQRPDLAVLYTSGYSMSDLADDGLHLELTDFLQKPYSPSSLAAKVREVLDARQQAMQKEAPAPATDPGI